jgi:Cu/Ag efflux protein CusF
MRLATTLVAATTLVGLTMGAAAQQTMTGMVTTIDRINGSIAIKQVPNGTVGAAAAATESYTAKADVLDSLHAGDRVKYSFSEIDGKKTLSKIEKD